ncbi:hypothetical protein DSS3P8_153 [Roseobacter phage DSS3P8]|nr:hypothetical protein DSS3P8_153 [Roseobacter phage DSS3P8]
MRDLEEYKCGEEMPPGRGEITRRGMDDAGDTALYAERDGYQIAQYDDWDTGKAVGWWKVRAHTFMALE